MRWGRGAVTLALPVEPGGASATVGRSLHYLRLGLRMTAGSPGLFLATALLFSLPAFAAAALAMVAPPETPWRGPALFVLQSVATAVAPVVFMMAVSAAYAGERISVWRVALRAAPWLPRYLWTNVHTSVIFWVPVGLLLLVEGVLSAGWLLPGGAGRAAATAWWLAIVAAGVFFHSRTVLAPFLAVHGDLPGTVAAWQSWRLSRKHLGLVVTLLLVACVPPALLLAGAGLFLTRSFPALAAPDVLAQLSSAGLQVLRLTLVPAFYMLYRDLWYGSSDQEGAAGEGLPGPLALLRAATARLPYRPGPLPASQPVGTATLSGDSRW